MAEKVQAIVLPAEMAVGVEAQIVPGIPGRWYPGVAYSPDALGLSLKQVKDLIAELNLPFVIRSVAAGDVRDRFDRPAGSHAPTSVLRPDVERDAANAAAAPETVMNEHGVPILDRPTPPPGQEETPGWVQAALRRNTALSEGRRDEVEQPAELTTSLSGIPLPDVGDPSDRPPEVELELAEAEAEADYAAMKKDELQAEAVRRGLDGAEEMTAVELRDALVTDDLEQRGLLEQPDG